MTGSAASRVLVLVGSAALLVGCGAIEKHPATPPAAADALNDLRRTDGRPPLSVLVREGDPRGAVAVAVATQGVAAERGAAVPVALAALLEARLDKSVTVVPSGDGLRAGGLVSNAAEAETLAQSIRAALLGPVTATELPTVRHKLSMLARRPLADAALDAAAKCAGDVVAPPGASGDHNAAGDADGPTLEMVEEWRHDAVRLGRVSMASAGAETIGDAVADALTKGPAWPAGGSPPALEPLAGDARVYDATGDVAAGGARVTLAARAEHAEQAVRAAELLGDPEGALAARLGGLDAPAKVRTVTATAHARGGCIVVELEIAPRDLAVDAPGRVATAIALARQEIATELAETPRDPALSRVLAHRASDPREAAELAAWWALSAPDLDAAGEPRITTAVGFASGREGGAALRAATATTETAAIAARAEAIRAGLDRAAVAWHEPVVESRVRIEKGQGDLWLAFGSPCGTLAEMQGDAGLGAAFALAAADRASAALHGSGASAEAWAAPDGIGVVVHGPPLPGESPEAHARRLADAVARSFAAEPVDRAAVSHARARLLAEDGREDARALVTLADAVAPGHPSWIAPMGPIDALGRSSDASVAARASALRAGPLRLAVLGDATPPQTDAAVRAVDRWIARRPGQSRACPIPSAPPPAHSATYAVESSGASQAWLALALPADDASARASASWVAAILDGSDGLLAHALGGGLARSWSAQVVGGAHASALVIRVDSAAGALDAAVAQVRALLDRLKQGSLAEADRARAATLLAERDLATALDPGRRVLALWRGPAPSEPAPPTLDALRAFASATLRDDALIIVAVRPPRAPSDRATPPPKPS